MIREPTTEAIVWLFTSTAIINGPVAGIARAFRLPSHYDRALAGIWNQARSCPEHSGARPSIYVEVAPLASALALHAGIGMSVG